MGKTEADLVGLIVQQYNFFGIYNILGLILGALKSVRMRRRRSSGKSLDGESSSTTG